MNGVMRIALVQGYSILRNNSEKSKSSTVLFRFGMRSVSGTSKVLHHPHSFLILDHRFVLVRRATCTRRLSQACVPRRSWDADGVRSRCGSRSGWGKAGALDGCLSQGDNSTDREGAQMVFMIVATMQLPWRDHSTVCDCPVSAQEVTNTVARTKSSGVQSIPVIEFQVERGEGLLPATAVHHGSGNKKDFLNILEELQNSFSQGAREL